jgi:serine/threonine protein kinase
MMISGYIGQQFGNYRLNRLLGQGGFADVYLGEHMYLRTQAAIKVLNMQLAHNEQEKFLAEARTIARLEHPHIISVLEFGIEKETPYLVMDYAANGTLRQRYPRGARLEPAQIVYYAKQVALALQYVHDRHLVHRDIKPENMLLGHNNDILLSDFGIALVVQQAYTAANSLRVVGTIAYMAPEQLRGDPLLASDQYALAAVIYEWLCGQPPFQGSFTEVAIQHALVPPAPLHERLPGIAPALEEVVMHALAKDPASVLPPSRHLPTPWNRPVCP